MSIRSGLENTHTGDVLVYFMCVSIYPACDLLYLFNSEHIEYCAFALCLSAFRKDGNVMHFSEFKAVYDELSKHICIHVFIYKCVENKSLEYHI